MYSIYRGSKIPTYGGRIIICGLLLFVEVFMNWDKPFKTFDEQIDHLIQEHNLIIPDRAHAKKLLSSISYYDLINGYKDCFMVNDQFQGETIEDLYLFFIFDRNIQNILFKYSIFAENRFKTLLAYILSDKYGVSMPDYLNLSNFDDCNTAQKVIDSINETLNSNHLENSVKHYKDNKNHIPAWILTKAITFNDSIDLFSALKSDSKQSICDLLFESRIPDDYKIEFAKNSLIIIRKFRNKIAHNLKFISYKCPRSNSIIVKNLSTMYGGNLIESSDFKDKRGRNDIYAMFLSLCSILHEPILIYNFIQDFAFQVHLVNRTYPNIPIWNTYCSKTNFPVNIMERMNHLVAKLKNNP